jgi:hypothetical protein
MFRIYNGFVNCQQGEDFCKHVFSSINWNFKRFLGVAVTEKVVLKGLSNMLFGKQYSEYNETKSKRRKLAKKKT